MTTPLDLPIPLTGRTDSDATPRKYAAVNDLNAIFTSLQDKVNELVGVGTEVVVATTLGTVIGKLQVFNAAGVGVGFLPVYNAIT